MEEFIIFFNSFVATFDANTISSWWMLCWCWCSCCCCCCYSYDYYFLFFSCSWPSRQLFFVFIVAFVCLAHNVSINSGWQRAISVLLTAIVLCFVSTRATSHSQTTSIYFFWKEITSTERTRDLCMNDRNKFRMDERMHEQNQQRRIAMKRIMVRNELVTKLTNLSIRGWRKY